MSFFHQQVMINAFFTCMEHNQPFSRAGQAVQFLVSSRQLCCAASTLLFKQNVAMESVRSYDQ